MNNSTTATLAAEPTVSVPRLGFVGVGWIGRHRMEAIAQSGFGAVCAISDPSEDALQKAAESVPEAARCSSFDEMLSQEDLDGIVIATPSALHADQAIAALRRGLAVFCQKPLARNAAETKRVIDTARDADRLLGVDLSYRYTDGLQRVRDLIQSGKLGKIYGVEAVFHNAYGPDKPWFYDQKLAGGGCLLDLGIHLVDAVLWCLDFPRVDEAHAGLTTAGKLWTPGSSQVEDYAAGLLRLDGGAAVQLACSWKVSAGCDARIEITFYGTTGGATFRNVNGSFYDFIAEFLSPDRKRQVLSEPPDAWGGRAAVEWAKQLGRSRRFDPTIAHLTDVAATLDRLYSRVPPVTNL